MIEERGTTNNCSLGDWMSVHVPARRRSHMTEGLLFIAAEVLENHAGQRHKMTRLQTEQIQSHHNYGLVSVFNSASVHNQFIMTSGSRHYEEQIEE